MKKCLVVLMGIMFLSVGNVFGGGKFNSTSYFTGNRTVSESSEICMNEAKKILNKKMKELSSRGSSAKEFAEALVEYDKNVSGCRNDALKVLLETRFDNSSYLIF